MAGPTGRRDIETPEAGPSTARPGFDLLHRIGIGSKLTLGFGVLVVMTVVVISLSYLASHRATDKIADTIDVRAPVALETSRAQENLLRMVAAVRGYLALGDPAYRRN